MIVLVVVGVGIVVVVRGVTKAEGFTSFNPANDSIIFLLLSYFSSKLLSYLSSNSLLSISATYFELTKAIIVNNKLFNKYYSTYVYDIVFIQATEKSELQTLTPAVLDQLVTIYYNRLDGTNIIFKKGSYIYIKYRNQNL